MYNLEQYRQYQNVLLLKMYNFSVMLLVRYSVLPAQLTSNQLLSVIRVHLTKELKIFPICNFFYITADVRGKYWEILCNT